MRKSGAQPTTETAIAILISVAGQPRQGYDIMRQVRIFSSDRIRLTTGTLYGALKRFLERGWIARVEETEPGRAPGSGRLRKAYILTPAGQKVVAAEAERLAHLAALARKLIDRARPAASPA